ncbi:MAG: tyrosine-type recombinase/integrase, partial [Armatimonadota bacterium]
ENTVIAYRATINRLLAFLEDQQVEAELEQVTTALLRRFVVHLKSTGIRNSTVARHIHGLKSFWRYIVETYDLQSDPTLSLRTPRVEHRIPDVLSEDECQRLLEACEENHFSLYRVRDRAMLKLMMILGLRRGEVIALRIGDHESEAGTLKIVDSKNRKSRVVPVPAGVGRDLDQWLELRPHCDHDRLFCSRQGAPLNPRAIYRMMDRIATAAGVRDKTVRPHMLRHTAATMALRNSGDLLATQSLLGHSDPSVTRVYCHLTTEDVRRTVAANPLSSSGSMEPPESRSGAGGMTEENTARISELAEILGDRADKYDALLDEAPELRQRWRRYWIADWCRHALAEGWPMSVADAQRIIWDGGVVEGYSIPQHIRVCNLRDILQSVDVVTGVPGDLPGWMSQLRDRLNLGVRDSDTDAVNRLSHLEIGGIEDLCPLAQAVIVAGRTMAVAPASVLVSTAAGLILTSAVSRRHVLPVYNRSVRWRGLREHSDCAPPDPLELTGDAVLHAIETVRLLGT